MADTITHKSVGELLVNSSEYLDDLRCMRTARDFCNESFDIGFAGDPRRRRGQYEIELQDVRLVYHDDGSTSKYKIGEFVGGVAYALALKGEIENHPRLAAEVSQVCFEIARIQTGHWQRELGAVND
jgi:hypothetical protein